MPSIANNCSPAGCGPRLSRALGLLAAALLLSPPVLAVGPTPYGEDFFRVGASWPDAWTGTSPQPPVQGEAAAEDYLRQLAELERSGGPYADTLAEPLISLGQLHWRSGDIAAARRHLKRALHLVRVNDGLYSERQVPILQALFESYRLSGNFQLLDDRYDYYFRLFGNGEPPFTGVRLGAAVAYLRWQREALRLKLDGNDNKRLLELYQLNQKLLDEVEDDEGVDFASYRALVMSQLRNLYLVEERIAPSQNTVVVASPPAFGLASSWEAEDFDQKRLEGIQRTALSRGRELLAGLIDRAPPGAPVEQARNCLALADWNQWHDRRTEALTAYGQAAELLRQGGREDLLQAWLGEPVELPDNGAFWQPRPDAGGDHPVVLQARFDVSAGGRARNVEASAAEPEHEKYLSGLARKLAGTRFRPRYVDGQAQATLQLSREYQWVD